MVDVIHIHEDDWGMRNLYPFAALSDAEKDIAEAAAAAERNRNPSGFGYTDMYIASPPSDRQLLWHFAGKLLFIQVMNQRQLMKGRRCRLNDRNVVGSGHSDTERPHYQNRHFVSAHFGSVDSKERLAAH